MIRADAKTGQDKFTAQINSQNSMIPKRNTLKNQIAQFNAQINLTQLKIADTQNKILLLGGRIDQLEVSLNDLNCRIFIAGSRNI